MTGWCHASLPDKQPVANNQWVGEKAEERTTCNFLGNKDGLQYQIFLNLLMTIFLSDFVELDWFVRHTTETIDNIPLCRYINLSKMHLIIVLDMEEIYNKNVHLERSWH